ncbi:MULTISPECIES: hypothetical protein [unclassified Bacillus (in: firmicutes)]|uniref:hypothetical protein n=1 Tax=unclassified Bacillus (in: firmicutes) TaxID=185979 RepID=UPI0008EA9A3A|nr:MULTISPECIES: hypothetical protein [unclassified Bacillus (in: firmicutes)]SFI02020.1 hypothetical protein SAMN04488574_101281 [Bacillus sp. 71mf]SFS91936.1 hypothetical protein SAMN04488145_1059 [Bacillus sp. 103mf]
MKQTQMYDVSVSEGQELIWHIAEVKRGHNMYRFEIHKATDCITVYFIGEDHSRFMITSLEEMLMMIPNEIEKKRYRNIVGNADWLLLNGIYDCRGMTEKEVASFLYLKNNVLDEMEASIEA